MGRKAFCCCSLRVGVIFIGSLSIVMALLGLTGLCVAANRLTTILLRPPARPAAPTPTPARNPDAEFVRVPRESAAHAASLWTAPQRPVDDAIERYSRLLLQGMDSVPLPLTDEGSTKATTHNASDINVNQSEKVEKNDSLNGSEESNANGRRQVKVSTEEVETDTRSSQKDRFAETTTDVNTKSQQPAGDETAANSFDSPQRTSKRASIHTSTELTSDRDAPNTSSENSFGGAPNRRMDGESTGRELEEEEGNTVDKSQKENTEPICGGPELEEMMFQISLLTAYEAVAQSREAMLRKQGSMALAAAMYVGGLGGIVFSAIVQVLHFGAGAMLIYGATKGRGELLRPWRLLAVATWAASVGGHAAVLAAFRPLRAADPTKVMDDAVSVAVLVVYLAIYAYCYSVVLKFERELFTKQQKKRTDSNEPEEKDHSNIYSSRF